VSAQARARCGRLASGMTTTNHHHIEFNWHHAALNWIESESICFT
jgi:hypothetical protein